jgi:hypothetical protein
MCTLYGDLLLAHHKSLLLMRITEERDRRLVLEVNKGRLWRMP